MSELWLFSPSIVLLAIAWLRNELAAIDPEGRVLSAFVLLALAATTLVVCGVAFRMALPEAEISSASPSAPAPSRSPSRPPEELPPLRALAQRSFGPGEVSRILPPPHWPPSASG